MNTSTRTVLLGKKLVTVTNVPTHFTDEQLKMMLLMKFYEINKKQVIAEMTGNRKAS